MDINERVRREWKQQTPPDERVRDVLRLEPLSPEEIASLALIDLETAQEVTEELVSEGVVVASESGKFEMSEEWVIERQAKEIRARCSRQEIREKVAEMKHRIQKYRTKFGVDEPEEVGGRRTRRENLGRISTLEENETEPEICGDGTRD